MKGFISRYGVCLLPALLAGAAGTAPAQAQNSPVQLGQLGTQGRVTFTRGPAGWGIRIDEPGRASMYQARPLQLRTLRDSAADATVAAGYSSVTKEGNVVVGRGQLAPATGVTVQFVDRWSIAGSVLNFERALSVHGSATGGYNSAIALSTVGGFTFSDVDLFFPGMLYGGEPEQVDMRGAAGLANFVAGRIQEREDGFNMPIFGVSFRDGRSIAVLDPSPDGSTVMADTRAGPQRFPRDNSPMPRPAPVIVEKMHVGGMGAFQNADGGVDLAFWYPGSLPNAPRYHPYRDGLTQSYRLKIRFGEGETFHDFYRNAWRWGWNLYAPKPDWYDLAIVQRTLADHLTSLIETRPEWSALPFMRSAMDGKVRVESSPVGCHTAPQYCNEKPGEFRWSRAIMGFVGKNLESASEILYDSYADSSARGEDHRQKATRVIDSFVKKVKVDPPNGSGFNVETGEPSVTNPEGNHVTCCSGRVFLREFTEDMRWVLWAYEWEKARGRVHADWLDWMTRFANWALTQQGADGSFPRSWYLGNGVVREPSTTTSYFVLNFFTKLSQVTGDPKYLEAAKRAGDYAWMTYHHRERYIGGPIDQINGLDKEAATLSLEGYLALYEATHDQKWLHRAQSAADFAETWIYDWNIPMPADEPADSLTWKPGVPTLGLNRVTAGGPGGDQWMAGDADEYARLSKHTGDRHYMDVARVLLYGTKAMLALPGRTYDLLGPGWQQEHWSMSLNRGHANHRNEFPWVPANHMNGLISLKIFDPSLYAELARPVAGQKEIPLAGQKASPQH
jgi:hypothetical protein